MTCASRRDAEVPAPPVSSVELPAIASVPEPEASASAPIASASATPESPPSNAEIAGGKLELPRFHGALAALERGDRKDHVRIVWIGDSHTAADLWSGATRKVLQKRFGDGGPGFVRLGWDGNHYRHEGVRLGASSRFVAEPGTYAQSKKFDDGVLGLGGIRFRASTDTDTALGVSAGAITEAPLKWDVAYRLLDGASGGTISIGKAHTVIKPSKAPAIVHFVATTPTGVADLSVHGLAGTELFGATIEGEKPGVTLDTVGLNGARIATTLAWDEAVFVSELKRRDADLVVIAFGTNESQQVGADPTHFGKQLTDLLNRVHAAKKETECLIITPPDRRDAEAEKRIEGIGGALRDAAIANHCAVWSAFDAMGGEGSMDAWMHESPPRGGGDGVHLHPRGYQFLGEHLGADLIDGVPKRTAEPSVAPSPRLAFRRGGKRRYLRCPHVELRAGTIVAGTYEIVAPLGRGGMGELFTARNVRTERRVALKMLRPDAKARADAMERFRREARAAGLISSDHVTQVLDVQEDPQHGIAIAFELLDGESLLERLRRTGPMTLEVLHPVVLQILRGLADAHAVGIIHRDLKPSNIYLEKTRDGFRAKILDFGISKLPKSIAKTTLTDPGQSLGSFMFMPPEQIQRASNVDLRADIYAVGTLVFQAMSGQLPYASGNVAQIVRLKTTADPRTLEEVLKRPVPPALEQWIATALARDRERRFQTANDMSNAWAALLAPPADSRLGATARHHVSLSPGPPSQPQQSMRGPTSGPPYAPPPYQPPPQIAPPSQYGLPPGGYPQPGPPPNAYGQAPAYAPPNGYATLPPGSQPVGMPMSMNPQMAAQQQGRFQGTIPPGYPGGPPTHMQRKNGAPGWLIGVVVVLVLAAVAVLIAVAWVALS